MAAVVTTCYFCDSCRNEMGGGGMGYVNKHYSFLLLWWRSWRLLLSFHLFLFRVVVENQCWLVVAVGLYGLESLVVDCCCRCSGAAALVELERRLVVVFQGHEGPGGQYATLSDTSISCCEPYSCC